MLCAEESFQFDNDPDDVSEPFYTDPSKQYDYYRMAIGLLEGGREMGNQFPLNVNLH